MAYEKNESKINPLRQKQILDMKMSFITNEGYPILEATSEEASQPLQDYTERLMDACNTIYTDYTSEQINLNQLKELISDQLKNENINSGSVMVDAAFVALRDRASKLVEINYQATNRNSLFVNQSKPETNSNNTPENQNIGMNKS